jgi:type III restriction enzyme
MALHKDFPTDPHEILDPSVRWFPADEAYRDRRADQLLPPLVARLRKEVKAWRDKDYAGATATSQSLLRWWFRTDHIMTGSDGVDRQFQYFFAQREALETIVYLTDVANAKDKYDLMRYDSSGLVSAGMFDETWRRYVVKMATGAGKTKVLSLVLSWCFFHKTYETDSTLARNFLVIAPNIIVLDRIRKDFDGQRIFFHDPVLPDDGFDGRDWRSDFQLTLHVQDEVRLVRKTGNIFLTNIHRVYAGNESLPTADDEDTTDYFLGTRPTGKTTDSNVDLGMIVRDIDELVVLNDEAHHIHNPKMAWFKSIQDIHHRLLQKDAALSMQIDVTATPRHDNGAIFVQTVADYPLVEAIRQDVVKHPVLPDMASRDKLKERKSAKFTEKYADYLHLGVIEWRKNTGEHEKLGQKAILFVMTDDTKNCDDVKTYLESTYADLAGAVLVIHTKNNGEISEAASGKSAEELEALRKLANDIDSAENKYKAIISVLMLKEGWDVRNVTTIVGLRSYSSKSNILPEQTLGRGLRKMYPGRVSEQVSVIGTDAFMEFVEGIQAEGVTLERRAMGEGAGPKESVLVEIDEENTKKNLDELDIVIPVMTPRIYREYKNLDLLDPATFGNEKIPLQQFSEEQQREIVFKDITTGDVSHTTVLDTAGIADYRSVVGYFAQSIMKDLRLVSGYDVLYRKVKAFLLDHLFDTPADLESPNTIRNLSEVHAVKTTIDTFKAAINALTVQDKGNAEIRDRIKLRNTRPFVAKEQGFMIPKRSVFNRIIGDSGFELEFAAFLDGCGDIVSFAKNFLSVGFKLDYVTANGSISNYIPDFFVKVDDKRTVIVETKGLEEIDLPQKMARLKQWCDDINRAQTDVKYEFVYVDEEGFKKYKPDSFQGLRKSFREYQ